MKNPEQPILHFITQLLENPTEEEIDQFLNLMKQRFGMGESASQVVVEQRTMQGHRTTQSISRVSAPKASAAQEPFHDDGRRIDIVVTVIERIHRRVPESHVSEERDLQDKRKVILSQTINVHPDKPLRLSETFGAGWPQIQVHYDSVPYTNLDDLTFTQVKNLDAEWKEYKSFQSGNKFYEFQIAAA